MHAPRTGHLDAVHRVLKCLKGFRAMEHFIVIMGTLILQLIPMWIGLNPNLIKWSTTCYSNLVANNLVSWKSKKQSVIAISRTKAEYHAMANGTYELLWLKIQLSKQGNIKSFVPMNLHCDNVVAIHIASNPMYHEYMGHRDTTVTLLVRKWLIRGPKPMAKWKVMLPIKISYRI